MNLPFAQPIWLLIGFFAAALLFILLLAMESQARKRLQRFAAPGLLDRLTASHSRRRLWIKNGLLLTGIFLLFLTLARPQWGANWEKAETRGIDIMIALDTSRSMMAEDISPNRLERSKLAILDLLEVVKGDRVGLIAFAGNAFLQCPLTLDYQAFRQTLAAVDTETIPRGGTDIASALDEADAYFEETGNDRLLIMITDGEDLEASGIQRAREAAANGTRILTVGVGSTTGELIPIRDARGQVDFLRDSSGNPVSTSLDESTLRRIAEVSNGLYAPLGPTGSGLTRVYEFSLSQSEKNERQEMLQRIPIERYQWPLLAAIFILMLEAILSTRRRGTSGSGETLALALATVFLMIPSTSEAGVARDAEKAYQDSRYEESASLYRQAIEEDPESAKLHYNLGVSLYRSENYNDAIAQFLLALEGASQSLQAKSFYNTGNSRVALGFRELEKEPALTRDQWNAALADFENAIALDPDLSKAQENLDALRATIDEYTHALTVTAEPPEGGTVSPTQMIFHRIPVEISAEAAEGWIFSEWTGDGIESPDKAKTTVQLEKDTTVTAQFVKTWRLEVLSEDPEMGSAGESGVYREDEPVTIKAEANDYFAFKKWIPEGCELADPEKAETEVILTADATVTASFVPAFKLSVTLDPEIAGKAGPSGFFEEYSVVPLQAEPRPGFEWKGWIGDGIKEPEKQESSIAMTADRIAIAQMERIWNLVIIPTPEEGGTVEGAGNHPVGSTVDISATPAEGFQFEGWEGPGLADPASPNTQVTVLSTEHTLFAKFAKDDQDDQNQDQDNQQDQQDQNQDQQNQQDQSDDQQQNQQQDQQEDQQQEDQQDSPDNPEQQQDNSEEQQQDEQPQDQEDGSSDPEEQEASESEQPSSPEGGEEEQPIQAVPGEMTREEARQLLNALGENEKFLPASERSRRKENVDTREGRNW